MYGNREHRFPSPPTAENPGAKFHLDNLKLHNRELNHEQSRE